MPDVTGKSVCVDKMDLLKAPQYFGVNRFWQRRQKIAQVRNIIPLSSTKKMVNVSNFTFPNLGLRESG